jgi:phage terminase small subunit
MAKKRDQLTEKQQRFVEEYLIDLNAARAVKRAGYAASTNQRAAEIGHQLLQKTPVSSRVQEAIDKRAKRTEITADRVLCELARIAFSDISDIADFGPDGVTLKPVSAIDPHDLHCISEIGEKPMKDGKAVYVKTWDKIAALRELEKHLGLCIDKKEIEMRGKLTFDEIIDLAEHDETSPDKDNDA